MINVGNIWFRVTDLLGKDQNGGYATPYNFNQNLIWANLRLTDKYVDIFEKTRVVSNNVRPFLKTLGTPEDPKVVLDSFGRADFPEDYYYLISASYSKYANNCGGAVETPIPIEIVDSAVWNTRLGNTLNGPSLKYPILKYTTIKDISGDYEAAIQIAPKAIRRIAIEYIRRPADPIFGYTTVDGNVVYDPTTSVNPEWPESAEDELVEMIVRYYGRPLHDEFAIKTSIMSNDNP